MTRKLEKEINDMCNLADAIEERGIEKGIEKGIEQGIELNAIQNSRNFFKNGADYELVRKSIDKEILNDETLKKIYDEVMAEKNSLIE